jgi:hypothetical protein
LTCSAAWQDMTMTAVSPAWREGESMSLTYRLNRTERNFSALSYARPYATTSGCVWLKGRFERPTIQVGKYGFHKARRKIKDCYFVEETVDPYSIEGLSHIEENRAC